LLKQVERKYVFAFEEYDYQFVTSAY